MKGYEKESFLAPLFKMLEATFELIVPLVVANIMDIGIKNQDNAYIWHQCVIMVLLGVIGLVCGILAFRKIRNGPVFFREGCHGI